MPTASGLRLHDPQTLYCHSYATEEEASQDKSSPSPA
jgi:hypothetical protein